jgi:hypothetical protein
MQQGGPEKKLEDFLLLHDNARPHTSLQTREAVTKLLYCVAPSTVHPGPVRLFHLFRPLKNAICG